MPGRQSHGRQSHGRPLATGPKKKTAAPNRRSTARAQATVLDAYNIAAKQFPQKEKRTPRSRFMDLEEDESEAEQTAEASRRNRHNNDEDDEDNEDDDDDEGDRRPAQRRGRRDDDGSDVEYGSDESGNEWRINGRIHEDEDSELDSDEAFGESDQEMFSGYAFGGSTSKSKKKNSDDEEEYDSDASSLGSDAVDLATALDMAEAESSEEEAQEADSESASNSEDSSSEENSEQDSSDEESDDDVDGPTKQKVTLKELASEFAGFDDDDDEKAISAGKQKISLSDLGLIKTRDANIRKSVKLLSKEEADPRGANAKLAVPLAPLQQAQVTRKVAFEKSAETLDRWTETIKANRRADHLQFPLLQDTPNASLSSKEFRPITAANASNELEKTMLDLLAQSGMSLERPKKKPVDDQGNELTPEQVAELVNKRRREREMRSREQKRAKRIKKIKSKAYHRIHRKQAQKDEMAIRAEMEANGELDSEAEREDAARKRALERVGARHRDSRWAKANSRTKRAVWDTDYREGIEDMARREIELKRRIEGKDSSSDYSDDDDSDNDSDASGDDNDADEKTRLRRQLAKLKAERDNDGSSSQLNKMDFMQRVESQRAHENDTMIREIERMLASDNEEESDPENMVNGQVGRRSFGGARTNEARTETAMDVDSDSDAANERPKKVAKTAASKSAPVAVSALVRKSDQRKAAGRAATEAEDDEVEFVLDNKGADLNTGDAWATVARSKKPSRKSKVAASSRAVELDISSATAMVLSGGGDAAVAPGDAVPATPSSRPAKKQTKAPIADTGADTSSSEGSDSESDNAIHHPLALRSERDLIARAFAGGDVVEKAFEAEKEEVIAEQEDKVVDNTLPGWGAWVGDGISSREANKHKGKFTTTIAGVKRKDRRDAKLSRVIINEKRVKKNDRYLASQLPHSYETADQYERSIRMPVGPEWMTKETFQASTKPRVLLKQGIIKPMSRPMR
ncbi:U3 small nucleolar RNA-associated protein 14 [Ceratocystis lukuohia]|uniref:U3 small nucleolar RNA-associated protein 14 n=1 Tax=Ceratocystis lukuohia TaxID=2019550 RepID=A0ABR4MJE1_9PEZI